MAFTTQDIYQAIQAEHYGHAEAACRQGLAERPDSVDLHHLLGIALHHQGRGEEGLNHLSQAIQLHPHHAELYNSLGIILAGLERAQEALTQYHKAIQQDSNYTAAWYNAARMLSDMGRIEDARQYYENAIKLNPAYAEAHNNLANLLKDLKRYNEAEAAYLKAIEHAPDYTSAFNNLGLLYAEMDEEAKARQCYLQAIQKQPNLPESYVNLALLLQYTGMGTSEEIHACYNKVFSLRPDYPEAKADYSLHLLREGRYKEGWALYESRKAAKAYTKLNIPLPEWQGQALAPSETLLIYGEQGLGDTLQFMRYLPLVRERVGRVVFVCLPALEPLLAHVSGIDVLVTTARLAEASSQATHYCHSLSLPHLFDTQVKTIPPALPPESWVQPAWVTKWQTRLPKDETLKVGIVWGSQLGLRTSRHRSCAAELLVELAQLPGISVYSLQKGPKAPEFEAAKAHYPQASLIDLSDELDDLTDAAGAALQMDVVITVDTMMAHLAGSLGKPVWVLLASRADWRWLEHRADSVWYPTARLFRQDSPGNWPHVIREVKENLNALQTHNAKDSVHA